MTSFVRPLAHSLGLSLCFAPLFAADSTPAESQPVSTAEVAVTETVEVVSTDERIAALEAEVKALREQLNSDEFATKLAEQLVIAQRKAMEPPSTEEAVKKIAEQFEFDAEKSAKIVETVDRHAQEGRDLWAKMRNGEVDRSEMRTVWRDERERQQGEMDALLTEEQQQALREAQRPPGRTRNTNNWGGNNWGNNRNRGNGGGGNRGGAEQPRPTEQAPEF